MTNGINPSHYKDGFSNGAEVIDITETLNFNRGNAIKYIARAGRKDPNKEYEDLSKAKWYLEREMNRILEDKNPWTVDGDELLKTWDRKEVRWSFVIPEEGDND